MTAFKKHVLPRFFSPGGRASAATMVLPVPLRGEAVSFRTFTALDDSGADFFTTSAFFPFSFFDCLFLAPLAATLICFFPISFKPFQSLFALTLQTSSNSSNSNYDFGRKPTFLAKFGKL